MDLQQISQNIQKIGQEMVGCRIGCEGITCRQSENILPRCLILETEGRALQDGVIIVGLNPGRSRPREQHFYEQHGKTYDQVMQFWEEHVTDSKYYTWLRTLADQLGCLGPILWTELAKCENDHQRRGIPPLQTLRNCTSLYLTREIAAVPESWPLLAVGFEAFKALAYLYPERAVVGFPHVIGSRGHFHSLFDNRCLNPQIKDACLAAMQSNKAVWLRSST